MAEKFVIPIHGGDHCPGGPDPIPCLAPGIEWFQVQADQSLGTTWTEVDLAGGPENGEYDTGLPTFDVDVDGHIALRKDGAYLVYAHVSNLAVTSNTNAVVLVEMVVASGPTTTFRRGLFGTPGGETALSPRRLDFATDVLLEEFPTISFPLMLKNGGYTGTPLEFYFNAYVEQNGSGVAKTCRFNLLIMRWPTYAG